MPFNSVRGLLGREVAIAAVALNCWLMAADRFNLPSQLLEAIAHVESGRNPRALNVNSDGSVDIGLMQINSRWLPELSEIGITPDDLYVPCINVHVGAWILAQEVERYGYSWEAIGAYHAGPYTNRTRDRKLNSYRVYARKVLADWRRRIRTNGVG